jgi:hypothetical protein
MSELEKAIEHAFAAEGATQPANKAYLEFIKENFIIPIEKNTGNPEPSVLYLEENGQCFLPVFTRKEYLDKWATEISNEIELLKLSGVDLLKGVGDQVIVCLNIGSDTYKEFNASELARMRSMVMKFFS